jgi:tetratricopeptide (TPR) repeat protein
VEIRLIDALAKNDLDEALKASAHIPGEFQRTRAILKVLNHKLPRDIGIAVPLFHEALKAGGNISDPYTRVLFLADLGRTWGRIDKGREAGLFEEALKVCKEISSPSLRAEGLETLAAAWKNSDKARAQAVIDSIEPAVFRARAAVAEVKLWAKTDLDKAKQTAESIPGNFPIEKAQAFKELGGAVRKGQPTLAFDFFEKAWVAATPIPEGGSREKILTQILSETALLNVDKSLSLVRAISDREMKDRLLREAGTGLFKEDSPAALSGALKIAKEISESSLRTPVYQKAADRVVTGPVKGNGTDLSLLAALSQWGKGREAAKREETEARPIFEKAFAEIGKIADSRDRALILTAMIGDWALADEGRALKAAETIPSEMAEAHSYGLLQAGVQFRKWSRQESERVFDKALKAAEKISEPPLRGRRMMQIAKEWQLSNQEKGKEVLRRAPETSGSPYGRAKSVLHLSNLFYKEFIEKDMKILEKALSFSQESKNSRLLTETALAWSWVDSGKAQEIVAQIDSKENRVKALCGLARQKVKSNPALAAPLLEKASQQAMAIDGLEEKISALRCVAGDLANLDLGKAKAAYQLIFQAAERADSVSGGFSDR